ncbi:unnamed protein product [Cyberlindnera jadinii]|uniref:Major facilitator superfamily (MFS) profile domain-containing protein n=1 Tax=Cyberlindnera jadinii (strain ATCC 18201 / CBS 1600 / BCRC 20928 / JCM 3617 / NBRC 0987 / NRRL Y-1542) TaxID=983966 RepID=A0A0H5C628_CYBJN|nr:unnamed protein product [Cyberlindnera jadinii]
MSIIEKNDNSRSSSVTDSTVPAFEAKLPQTSENVAEYGNYKILLPDNSSFKVIKDWTQEEEDRARWKVDLTLLPLLVAGFFALQLDRGNLANALTSTFMKDVGVDSHQINVGQQMLSLGIVLGEIPCNYVLQKVGPSNWLPFQTIVWGSIALSQGWIKNYGGFIATRLLLGLGESGYIPGGLYTISKYYTKKELGRRHTIYFVGNLGASALGGLIAAGILKDLTDVNGWSGWRWLFFIEGIVTIAVGVVLLFLLPKSTQDSSTFLLRKWQLYTERERYILTQRLILDDPLKALDFKGKITVKDVGRALWQIRPWLHFFITITSLCITGPIGTYLPLIVRKMGYTQFRANAMSSIGTWISLVYLIIIGQIQDRFKPKATTVIAISGLQMIFVIVFRGITTYADNHLRLGILIMIQSFSALAHIVNTSWISMNSRIPTDRAIHLALIICAANASGIYNSQILNTDDGPHYTKAFTALAVISIISFLASLFTYWQYVFSNRKLEEKYGHAEVFDEEELKDGVVTDDEGFVVLDHSKAQQAVGELKFRHFRYTP